MNVIHALFCCLRVFEWQKRMLILLYLVQLKYAKIQKQEISSIGLNVLEFSCVLLYPEFLSDHYRKFQVATVYDTNVEYQIFCFC